MTDTSRRKLLAGAGAGVAAGAVGMTMGPARASAANEAATPHEDGARESVVAYIEDHRSAEVRLLVGEREHVVHDRDLVTRILNAAKGS